MSGFGISGFGISRTPTSRASGRRTATRTAAHSCATCWSSSSAAPPFEDVRDAVRDDLVRERIGRFQLALRADENVVLPESQ